MMDIQDVRRRVAGHGLVCAVDQVPRGHIRLETALLYPDGSSIDVFLVEDSPLLRELKLSDLGQTTSWLLDVQVKPWLSKKRQRLLEDALRIYDVKQVGGALEQSLDSLDHLVEGVIRLGQACVRVAGLTYTRRGALQTGVTEDVEELLADSELAYDADAELDGRYGTKVRVDFLVKGTKTTSAVLALASGNSSQAHAVANEVFRRWYDLDVPQRTEQRVTVFDDHFDVYRDEDLRRLRDLSEVVALSDRRTLKDLLAA
jgi:hypothetical protein